LVFKIIILKFAQKYLQQKKLKTIILHILFNFFLLSLNYRKAKPDFENFNDEMK